MRQLPTLLLAILLSACMTLGVFAEKNDATESAIRGDSSVEIGTTVGFTDVDSSDSVLDWGADSNGPDIGFKAKSGFSFAVPSVTWLRMGPSIMASGNFDLMALSTTDGDPYLVGQAYDLLALVGWDLEGAWRAGELAVTATLTPLGGVDVLDLTDADVDYLYTGADPADFWFRVLPCLGFSVDATVKRAPFEIELYNRYLTTWDSGTAYGRSWSLGFDERCKISLTAAAVDTDGFDLRFRLLADYKLKSNLIEPSQDHGVGLRSDLAWKGVGSLRLTVLRWTSESDLPALNFAAAENVENQLSSGIAWVASGRGDWSIAFAFPWFATLDGAAADGVWSLAFTCKIGD